MPQGWPQQYGPPPGWGPSPSPQPFAAPPAPEPRPSALPVTPREYHEFFRAPRFRWWKPILSLLMFGALFLLASTVVPGIAILIDLAAGRVRVEDLTSGNPSQIAQAVLTPLGFTANNLALALSIPMAGLTGWAVYGQRPRWMSSIVGGFRWRLAGQFALVALPIFLLSTGLDMALAGVPEFRWNPDSLFLIVVILLTTPFQSAGEEYGLRGLVARSIGSWFSARRLGLAVAAVLSSLLFMVLHGADNLWLNIYYFCVGMICSVLAWRTGGLEAPVALHVCNNLVSEINLPFGGLEGMFDRGPGAVGPEILFQLLFTLAVMAGMLWLAGRRSLQRTAAPAAVPVARADADRGVFFDPTHTIA